MTGGKKMTEPVLSLVISALFIGLGAGMPVRKCGGQPLRGKERRHSGNADIGTS